METEEIGIAEARPQLTRIVNKVRKGEEVVITHHGHPVARMVQWSPKSVDLDLDGAECWACPVKATGWSVPLTVNVPQVEGMVGAKLPCCPSHRDSE